MALKLQEEQMIALIQIAGCRYMGKAGIDSYFATSPDQDEIMRIDQITSILNCISETDTCHAGYQIKITAC